MILDVNKIQEGECLAWVSSPVRTLAVWTSFNKAVKTIKTIKHFVYTVII
jgi:hypothetical protein